MKALTLEPSRLMEPRAKYCDVIVKRWQDFAGKTAHLEDRRAVKSRIVSRSAGKNSLQKQHRG